MKLAIVVPVSPFEPVEILKQSALHLKSLDYRGMVIKLLYVVDLKEEGDERVKALRKLGVEVLERRTTRGKRAGAINDALKALKDFMPDYIAIFDVDSRPAKDFVVKCVKALENDAKAYIASSPRYISNPINLVSKTIEAEYHLINFLLRRSGFRQFNGLIGVLRAKYLFKYRLREGAVAEDADFATRMHARGLRAIFVGDTLTYEQSPLSWKDLFNQRKRWYYGGLQLWRYWKDVKRSRDSNFILSWFMALTFTYFVALLLPLMVFSPPLIIYRFRNVKKLVVVAGLVIHTVLLQYAAIQAMLSFARKRGVEWKAIERSL
ncbi:glycosyltransferase [Archaeoglobus veneficus]|uniref:Glycosyltransferase 2-like domain-containing protein n=1 Tax=Archaeoglobus veneficus (strain DSM 11195 / SNP6) TaxID=693661 RepID=F2KRG6_ARCVS|nr:glycosyltransferase family 2 protein [Archaeoglobus veneficus]AEA46731.1 hypothetical protein Arcve_0712 [Archaeoglobus veneficus SNP6]